MGDRNYCSRLAVIEGAESIFRISEQSLEGLFVRSVSLRSFCFSCGRLSEGCDFGTVLRIFNIGGATDDVYCFSYAQIPFDPLDPPWHRRGVLLPVAV
jgi:hypothetical protein